MKLGAKISDRVISRLPKYSRTLKKLDDIGVDRVSSSKIADTLGYTPSQVRQDFSMFGTFGATGYGYNVQALDREIQNILGTNKPHSIVLVGVGGIGRALLEHMDFEEYNYSVLAAFDINPEVVGETINGIQVQHMDAFADFVSTHAVDICMLTVARAAVRSVAKCACQCGIPAIWNFSGVDLEIEFSDVVIQNVNFLDSLFVLTYYLEQHKNNKHN